MELMSELIPLSKQKFSSNVIEKCLEHNTIEMNEKIVECLIHNQEHCYELLSDQFGNYVIQKCLAVAQEPLFSQLKETIKKDVEKIA
mmetsp:Transcript_29873/g.45673  ORF Transcript_29873/g.45673 Transcript_29873/m.45673 type:complete len:87 (+) Transcript_29873:4418-4678(+)